MPKPQRTRRAANGKCQLCQGSFSKAAMTAHLETCVQKTAAESTDKKLKDQRSFYLIVSGGPHYWLHLSARDYGTLEDLDRFLREIWLECCGHMSVFRMGKDKWSKEYTFTEVGPQGKGKAVALEDILKPGMTFYHEYDFGTPTELDLKVVSAHPAVSREDVALLARNDPPEVPCTECGQPAEQICSECMYEDKGPLCAACVNKHECDKDMLMPLSNSPRAGVCGYEG